MANRGCDGGFSDHRAPRRPERPGDSAERDRPHPGAPRFVVQRHDLSSLHFDLRLEIDGVLASWAVPKGPSVDAGDKRLATRTEDHSLGYLDFEGRMPVGEYGGGTVVVWDRGTYRNLADENVSVGLRRGYLKVWLEGDKLTGCYALTQIKLSGDQRHWLLVKLDDEDSHAESGADHDRRTGHGEARNGHGTGHSEARNGYGGWVPGSRESVLSGYAHRDS
ncbi:MAG TPA: DNA polymerase ligase N-terminal domain-containing protein [Pseudonocardia sp.]|nr:DNA polymerase ligase N-terminal domain-containing protein [Pseudonocardia sp.]